MHPIETDYKVYTFSKGSEGGDLIYVASGFTEWGEANAWLKENAEPKKYYVILQTYRRQ